MKTRLSVNVNKIATLRNARGGNIPNLYQFVKDIRIILIKERIDPKKDKILTNKKDSKYQKNLAKIQNPELKKKINNLINAFSNKK